MIHLAESELERLIKLVKKYEGNESTLLFPLKQTLKDKKKENVNYIENFLTAADYCDDMWEDECAKVIRKTYVYPKTNYWYRSEQKIPNIDVNVKTHSEWGPVGKLPGKNPIKY
tara:strand:+ start:637 stop:978 length:342 start_codon:yes stop_codon:yes gene_type:complete